jgi:hypothetical protein
MNALKLSDFLLTWSLCFLPGCGGKTEVIDRRKDTFTGPVASQRADDLQKRTAEDEEFLARLQTPAFLDCQGTGMLFDRRKSECSTEFKIGDFICDRNGIQQKFVDSGFQIVAILDQALGNPQNPKDRGEGFLVDQCGVDSSGRVLILLVKPTVDGRITIREIQ